MRLLDRLKATAPDWLKDRWPWLEPQRPLTDDELRRLVERGLSVAQMMASPGWQVYEEELAVADKAFAESLLEEGLDLRQYDDRRGIVAGFREKIALADDVVRRGLQAERELEARSTQRKVTRQ